MKRILSFIIGVVLAFNMISTSAIAYVNEEVKSTIVNSEKTGIEEKTLYDLFKDEKGGLLEEKIKETKELTVDEKSKVTTLEGIESFINLEKLVISSPYLKSLKDVKNLEKLKEVKIIREKTLQITDLSGFENCPNIEKFDIDYTNLRTRKNNTKILANQLSYYKEDVNKDGVVDYDDYDLVAAAYNTTSSSPEWNPIYDINDDGIVDLFDLILIDKKIAEIEKNTPKILVESLNKDINDSVKSILPRIKIKNIGQVPLDTSKLEVRYYYTSDNTTNADKKFYSDWSNINAKNLNGDIYSFETSNGVEDVVSIKFNKTEVAVNSELEMHIRMTKSDWSFHNQLNDASFVKNNTTYTENKTIEVRYEGKTIWGHNREENDDPKVDTDNDGLPNIVEDIFGGDKNKEDTDDDGLTDEQEYRLAPYCKLNNPDTDGDGISDLHEDLDGDGLTNEEEFKFGTEPLAKDTDLDGLDDKEEIEKYKTDPTKKDTDGDGLTDKEEIDLGTDPNNVDTDGNGVKDSEEKFETVNDTHNEIKINAVGDNKAVETLKVDKVEDEKLKEIPGLVSNIYDIKHQGTLDSISINFEINTMSRNFKNADDLKIMYFDEKDRKLKPVEGVQTYSQDGRYISILASYVGIYMLVSYSQWLESWNSYTMPEIAPPDIDGPLKRDFLILSDNSKIMKGPEPPVSTYKVFDKEGLLIEESQNFINKLFKNDRVAVAKFNSRINNDFSRLELTNLKGLALAAIEYKSEGDYYPFTINDIIPDAVNMLLPRGESNIGENKREKYLLIMASTPPFDSERKVFQALRGKGIRVIIFDCNRTYGNNDDKTYFNDLATATGGKHYILNDNTEFEKYYKEFLEFAGGGNETDNRGEDTDEDGISDELETIGLRDGYGVLRKTDPNNPDTDGDGILDGAEARLVVHDSQEIDVDLSELATGVVYDDGFYFNFISDPSKADSDDDGLGDLYELEYGVSDIWNADSDDDGLSDRAEINLRTDPLDPDTDGDTLTDYEEALTVTCDPLVFNEVLTTAQYAFQFLEGYLLGDGISDPTTVNMIGAIASCITPGLEGIADFRDMIFNLAQGELIYAGANLVGLIPVVGDGAQVPAKVAKYIDGLKDSTKLYESVSPILRAFADLLPHASKLDIIKRTLETAAAVQAVSDFFGLTNPITRKPVTAEQAAEVVAFMIKGREDKAVAFIEGIKLVTSKIDPTFINSSFKDFGKHLNEIVTDTTGKFNTKLAERYCQEIVLDISYLNSKFDNFSDIKKAKFMARMKGYMGEFVKKNEMANAGWESIIKPSKRVNAPGPDDIAILKNVAEGEPYVVKIMEAKCYKNDLVVSNMPNYFNKEKTLINAQYLLEYLRGDLKEQIINDLKDGKAKLELDLFVLQPDDATNIGLGKEMLGFFGGGDEASKISKTNIKLEGGKLLDINLKYSVQKLINF